MAVLSWWSDLSGLTKLARDRWGAQWGYLCHLVKGLSSLWGFALLPPIAGGLGLLRISLGNRTFTLHTLTLATQAGSREALMGFISKRKKTSIESISMREGDTKQALSAVTCAKLWVAEARDDRVRTLRGCWSDQVACTGAGVGRASMSRQGR
jgi:hypothetical protein